MALALKTFIWRSTSTSWLPRLLFGGQMGIQPTNQAAHMGSSCTSGVKGQATERKRKYTVAVEGNIGCGKSLLLEYFKKFPTVEALPEPVEQWTNIHGFNGLELLYSDPTRWNFTFNNYVMLTRMRLHEHMSTMPVKMLERSIFSTYKVFVENAFRSNCMTTFEKGILGDYYNHLISINKTDLDLIVYLRVSPEICYQRIKERNRKEERTVPFELISNLHNLYEEWLLDKSEDNPPAPVLVLDASPSIPEMEQTYEEKKAEILFGCV